MHPNEMVTFNEMIRTVPGLSLPGLDAILSQRKVESEKKTEQEEGRDTPSSCHSGASHRKGLTRPRTNDGKPIPFRGFSRNPALQLALIEAVHAFKPFGYGNVRSGWLKVQQHMNNHALMDVFERDGVRLELSWQLCRDVFGRIVDEWKSCDCYQTKMDGVFIEDKVERWNRLLADIHTMTVAQTALDERKRKREDDKTMPEPSPKGSRISLPSQNELDRGSDGMESSSVSALAFLQSSVQRKPINCAQVLVGSTPEPSPREQCVAATPSSSGPAEDLKLLRQSIAMLTAGKITPLDLSQASRLPSGVVQPPASLPLPSQPVTLSMPSQPTRHGAWPMMHEAQSVAAMTSDADKGRNKPDHEMLLARILLLQEQQLEEQRRFHEQSLRSMNALEGLVQTVTVMATETSTLLRMARAQD